MSGADSRHTQGPARPAGRALGAGGTPPTEAGAREGVRGGRARGALGVAGNSMNGPGLTRKVPGTRAPGGTNPMLSRGLRGLRGPVLGCDFSYGAFCKDKLTAYKLKEEVSMTGPWETVPLSPGRTHEWPAPSRVDRPPCHLSAVRRHVVSGVSPAAALG